MKTFYSRITFCLAVAFVAVVMTGCNPKNVSYMQDLDQTVLKVQTQQEAFKVEPGDKISIIVHSRIPLLQLSSIFLW